MKKKVILGIVIAAVLVIVIVIGGAFMSKNAEKKITLNEAVFGNMEFEIPEPVNLKNHVGADMFGFSTASDDNTPALVKMADYLAKNPDTEVKFQKGKYFFAPTATTTIDSVKNCVIDGGGSEFVYSCDYNFIQVKNSDTLEIKNFDFDWDYDRGGELGTIIKITEANDKKYKAQIIGSNSNKDMDTFLASSWQGLTEVNGDTMSMKAGNTENYDFDEAAQNRKKLSETEFSFDYDGRELPKDMYYMIRHKIYQGHMFTVVNSGNITFDSLNVYGISGMVCIPSNGSHHIRFNKVNLGKKDGYVISATADGIHFSNGGGYYIVENCDMSFAGDDFINIHPNAADITDVTDDGDICLYSNGSDTLVPGRNVGIVTDFDNKPTITAKIVERDENEEYGHFKLKLDKPVDRDLLKNGQGAFLCDLDFMSNNYIIRNNKFHDGRARGILLNSSYGLVENNEFYHNGLADIRMTVDHAPGSWVEGMGFDKILIRNNNLHDSCFSGGDAPITFYERCEGVKGSPFRAVLVTGNTIKNYSVNTLQLSNIYGFVFENNTLDTCSGKISIDKSCFDVKIGENEYVNCKKRVSKPATALVKNIFG